jgi:glyoxylase-like metal-dependent hydrolase (beta-lactamase superfamily II)
MKISVIDAGNFKLDGGAMFGVVPKTMWQKMIPADDNNLCNWKMRCLLLEIGQRLVLIDTGMGDKQPQKWQDYYFRNGDGDLINSIRNAGYHENEVTDVILSHLHFDHVGGAVKWNSNKESFLLTFPNAHYWSHSEHWNWAMNPNLREKATFLKENLLPIWENEQMFFVDSQWNLPEISFITGDGHTEKMIMPVIETGQKKIIFAADTIPSHAHIHVPYCMAYDVRPLETMKEKSILLEKVTQEEIVLVFDHDLNYESALISKNEKGYYIKESGNLSQFININ